MIIRILIEDDHAIVRSGIRSELAAHNDLEVIGEAQNGDETLKMTLELQPDILFLDISMPGLKTTQILSRLRLEGLGTRVMIFTACDDRPTVMEVMKTGVQGYFLKGDDPENLVGAIRVVANGKTWLSPTIADMITCSIADGESIDEYRFLNSRGVVILRMLAQGQNSAGIAKELNISVSTVNYHIEQLFRRLHVKNRAEAVALGVKKQWIQP